MKEDFTPSQCVKITLNVSFSNNMSEATFKVNFCKKVQIFEKLDWQLLMARKLEWYFFGHFQTLRVSNCIYYNYIFNICNWKKCWIRLGRIFSHIFMPNMSFSPVSEDFFDWQKIWATWHAMAYHCQSDCQTSWFKDMSSVLIILCLFFYLAIIWQSQVKVYFSLDLILLLSDPIPYVARSKLTLHSAQLFRRGWCWDTILYLKH